MRTISAISAVDRDHVVRRAAHQRAAWALFVLVAIAVRLSAAAQPPHEDPRPGAHDAPAGAADESAKSERSAAERPIPAEERRLSTGVFRAALEKRGLADLLQRHLLDYPPSDVVARVLMEREVKLAEFADAGRSTEQRLAAADEANRMLESLIADHPEDARRLDWMFRLAHSLIYDEAQPLITSVLYRGGSSAERARLRLLTERALGSLQELVDAVDREYVRIDAMSAPEFERLERTGVVEALDRMGPKAQYLRLWTLFYDALGRNEADTIRVGRLREVVAGMTADPALIKTPQEQSHVQVQSLLLAGMTLRRLNDHIAARGYLEGAIAAAERIADADADERRRVDWAVTLAFIERVHNERDDGRFDSALRGVARLRDADRANGADPFAVQLVAALLERSILQARAQADEELGQPRRAADYRSRAWQALAKLAGDAPDRRDELYAVLYDVIGPDADIAGLDPMERCSLIAGLLYDAQHDASNADALLRRAIDLGTRFAAEMAETAPSLAPEMRYNVAVAQYRLGEREQAVRTFMGVARNNPDAGCALGAATLAVQLAAETYESFDDHPAAAQRLYGDALETIVSNYAESEAGRYWRFFYARFLDERELFDAAAGQYAKVDANHEHAFESAFLRLRATALGAQRAAQSAAVDAAELRRRANDVFTIYREFTALAARRRGVSAEGGAEDGNGTDHRVDNAAELLARARLLTAEVLVLREIDRFAQALDTLADFGTEFMADASLAARVWRVRLAANERLGRLEEAAQAIPEYLDADPTGAGETIERLYRSVADEAERLRAEGEESAAKAKAHVALTLATRIHEWAMEAGDAIDPVRRRALTVQLAEANLGAGRHQPARELFDQCARRMRIDESGGDRVVPADPLARRVLIGRAEAMYGSGAFGEALPIFNRFAIGLLPGDPARWRALLRDLQCRTELGHAPKDVLKVIDQQRRLHPDMGGPALAAAFDRLYLENQRRRDGG